MNSRFLRLAAVAVMASALAAGCGKYSISNIRSLKAFSDANGLYKKNDYKAAIARYQDAVRLNPEQGLVYFFLGHSNGMLYKPGKKDQPENVQYLKNAVENYRLAIDKLANSDEPKAPEIRKLAFEYLIEAFGPDKLDDFSQAEPIAKQLIALEPGEPARYQMLGKLYQDQGRYDEAEAQFLKAIELRPKDASGYAALANFYNSQGNFEKTMEAWNRRAEAEPNSPEAWQTIASYYWDKSFRDKTLPVPKIKEYTTKGLEAVDKALALNSEYFQAVAYKGILLQQQARYEKDPAVQKKLLEEGKLFEKKANELNAMQNAGAGGSTPGGKAGTPPPGGGGKSGGK